MMNKLKIVTYNINGIRAAAKLGLLEWVDKFDADIYCFQEVRAKEDVARKILYDEIQDSFFDNNKKGLENYYKVYNCGSIAGYAGTLILTKALPDKIQYDMGNFWKDEEGRTTTIFFENQRIVIVNAYVPNGNSRLEFKMKYLEALKKYLQELQKKYSVICLGDFNIAHQEIDLTNPKECKNKSVFLPIERKAFQEFIEMGFVDGFRTLYPEKIEYSWRSYKSRMDLSEDDGKNKNFWKYRIDYIIFYSKNNLKIKNCEMPDLVYSDHLPVVANFEMRK